MLARVHCLWQRGSVEVGFALYGGSYPNREGCSDLVAAPWEGSGGGSWNEERL